MRGDRRKQEERNEKGEGIVASDHIVIDVRGYKRKRIPQLIWRECTPRTLLSGRIKKIWEADPPTCPKCTEEMKIISFIYKKTVIRKILTHLNLNDARSNQRVPPMSPIGYTERVKICAIR